MKSRPFSTFFLVPLLVLFTQACGAESHVNAGLSQGGKPVSEATVHGHYVFSGRVLLNPITDMSDPQAPVRSLVQCFSVGSLWFDGAGGMEREIEIFCPTTPEMIDAGFGAPPPVGVPGEEQLRTLGSSLSTRGSYTLAADGWGVWTDEGSYRIGPIQDIPAVGVAQFAVAAVSQSGLAREIHILIKNQSLKLPGAPMLINGDVGGSFVARRR